MQEILFESPWIVIAVGLFVSGLAAFVWLQMGHSGALYSTVGLAVLTLILVAINLNVQTDRETLRGLLSTVAGALQRNDRETVYSYIHPNAAAAVQRAKSELPNYEFEEARVTTIKSIQVNRGTRPPTAIAEFNVRVRVAINGSPIPAARFVRVYFMLRDEQWLVTDYEHFEPTAGFRNSNRVDPAIPEAFQ